MEALAQREEVEGRREALATGIIYVNHGGMRGVKKPSPFIVSNAV